MTKLSKLSKTTRTIAHFAWIESAALSVQVSQDTLRKTGGKRKSCYMKLLHRLVAMPRDSLLSLHTDHSCPLARSCKGAKSPSSFSVSRWRRLFGLVRFRPILRPLKVVACQASLQISKVRQVLCERSCSACRVARLELLHLLRDLVAAPTHYARHLRDAGYFECSDDVVVGKPSTVEQLQQQVLQYDRVKAVGVGHSWWQQQFCSGSDKSAVNIVLTQLNNTLAE